MNLEDLKFGDYKEIAPHIVEVVIHEGVEFTEGMVAMSEQALLDTYCDENYCLLINRINDYSHTLGSMQAVPKHKNAIAVAIVVYSKMSEATAKLHSDYQNNVRVFADKAKAVSWLTEMLE